MTISVPTQYAVRMNVRAIQYVVDVKLFSSQEDLSIDCF